MFYVCFFASIMALIKFILVMNSVAPIDKVTSALSYLTITFVFAALAVKFLEDKVKKD
ncbi:hypothetical protein FDG96_gp65 [Bacillus phage Mgbh1]|uniref:Uncharacterized protein n=1 Tax=Bacillus phage Mgbh1 TaxID=1796993 RepID=A0A142F1R7_9CAUD|nr:hypothetical protein FDG96_gp65 [Bacillus phage Mgbh1]AMQ66724.1 hypothetical protein [Bacillus phage Mgbh1]